MADDAGTALVTGASGFVGSHLVEELLERGVRVRALLRAGSSTKWLPQSPLLEVHRASFSDPSALARALEGVRQVFHLAAVTSAPLRANYVHANTDATRHLVEAVRSAAPDARFVLCSTQAAAGPSRGGRPLTELDVPNPISMYGESKLAAERVVLESGLHAAIVRPPTVYGPRDRDIYEMFRWAARGICPVVGRHEQRISIIHVHDLVRALAAAAGAPAGSTYFVTDGAFHTRVELLAHINRAVKRQPFQFHIPVSLAMTLAHVTRVTARLAGVKPLLTPDRIRDFSEADWTVDDSRVRAELGYQAQVSITDGMNSTAQWYREQGWI